MTSEYRPRIRVSRKHPVTRKGRYILTVCKTEEDAQAVTDFLITMFAAARRDEEKTKAALEQMRIDAQYEALVQPEKAADPVASVAEVAPEVTEEPKEDE